MKSTTHLAAVMLTAAMLAGCVTTTEPGLTVTEPYGDGYAPERSVAAVKAMIRADGGRKPFPDSGPRSNVRADDLRALFADRVVVGYWSSSGFQGGKRALSLFVAVHSGDGRSRTCSKPIRELIRKARWSTRTMPGPDGQVWPTMAGPFWDLSTYIYDPASGEVAIFLLNRERTQPRRKGSLWGLWFGHVQERLPRAVYRMCPNFPSPEALGLEVNEAQTARYYDDLVAQDPGRRVLRPDLITPHEKIVAEHRHASPACLRTFRHRLEGAKGRAFSLDAGTGRRSTAVHYAPLSVAWLLGTRDLASAHDAKVASTAKVSWHAGGDGWSAHLRLDLQDGRTDRYACPLPDFDLRFARNRHPRADTHHRLLAAALAGEVSGRPAGSRFVADGTVLLPEGARRGRALTWKSHGDTIEIVRSGRSGTMVPLDGLVAALGG
ncbi:MAG: hypothetical protein F4Y57_14170 [Acidobacteria bacterium]|nr:hypothetical protein [Acidobacteriota bacterium]